MSLDLIINDDEKFNRAVKMAGTLAKSKIVPAHFQGKAEDIFAVILAGSEMGMLPMQSLNAFIMIQGQTSMKAQAQLAVVRNKIPSAYIKIETDEKLLIAKCTCARSKDDLENSYTATWDMAKAAKMGLASKQNYVNQPLTMLRWRAITEALRAIFSDVLLGFYAPEELEELPPLIEDSPQVKNETMSQALRREVEEDFPIPPEEKLVGPLYRVQHGTTMGGKQLKDFDKDEIDQYLYDMKNKKKKMYWMPELIAVLETYLANYDMYREMIIELNETSMVQA
jgi:hypothetical protein